MRSLGVKLPQTADLGCVQRAQGVPLLGHSCFWVEVIAILYTDMSYQSHPRRCVLNKIQLNDITNYHIISCCVVVAS